MPNTTDFTNFANDRPNYFPGQFLLEDDFELQHKYLGDRHKYHNASLHLSGIISGLDLAAVVDKKTVTIQPGSAIDRDGNLIVLKQVQTFTDFKALKAGEIYIQYQETKQLKQQQEIEDSYTRWQEIPLILAATTTPDNAIALGKFTIIADDEIRIDLTTRLYSGINLPTTQDPPITLRSGGISAPTTAILNGSLKITGNSDIQGNQTITGNQSITGSLNINGTLNVTGSAKLNNVFLGDVGHGEAWGGFSHKNNNNVANYALIQSSDGFYTLLNKKSGGGYLGFRVNNVDKMVMLDSGNVGIGLTNPNHILHIKTNDAVGLFESTGTQAYLRFSTSEGFDNRVEIANRPGGRLALWTGGGGDVLNITKAGNVGIGILDPGGYKLNVQGNLFISEKITLPGTKQLIFSDADVTNNLKIQLWSGYGLGINSSTLFYASGAFHSWRDGNGTNERMKLSVAADGGLEVKGTGTSSFAGNLSVTGALAINGNNDINFARTEKSKIVWNSNVNFGSDKAFILFKDNSNFTGTSGEDVRLSIGVYNDFGQNAAHGDALDIQGGARLTFNAGTWDTELNTEIGTPAVGVGLKGISFRINNTEKMNIDSSGNTNILSDLSVTGGLTVTGIVRLKNVMFGLANAYQKAQFTMSGGGVVSWGGTGSRLKWTNRFIAISMERSPAFPGGHINIYQPATDIPAANVYDGAARSANADGVVLTNWEALYAVHTVNGDQTQVSFRIVRYTHDCEAPSNWILVAVVNGDDNSVKLGTGDTIGASLRNDVILGGLVNSNGTIASGTGFSVSRYGVGLYQITFARAFSSNPAVIATQYYGSDTGSTLDNAIVTFISTTSCKIHTGNGAGASDDRWFSFMCIGSR